MSLEHATPGVVVFGSLNMDLVVRVPRMPEAGETLAGRSFLANPGGKGANQAVACARQGARVDMAGRVGNDAFGAELRAGLRTDGIDVQGVIRTETSTGVAMIMVDDAAQNCIAIVPGANASVSVEDAQALRGKLADAGMLVLQLEVPMEPLVRAAVCHDIHSAHQSVEHDDVNVMCIGAQIIGPWLANDLIGAFIAAKFAGDDEDFRRRVAKLHEMDSAFK